MNGVELSGAGLFTGRRVRVVLSRRAGEATCLMEVPVAECAVVDTFRTTTLRAGHRLVTGVEHLFASLAALGLHEGIAIDVVPEEREDDSSRIELPLLDGGAAAWFGALRSLAEGSSRESQRSGPLVIARAAVIHAGDSHYTFEARAADTSLAAGRNERHLAVELEWPTRVQSALDAHASWRGEADDFGARLAPARTFAFAGDIEAMVRHGLSAHVDPRTVVVIGDDGAAYASGAAFSKDEPARHKLLDLIGDLFVYGGPPRGVVRARRPGHAATHRALSLALASGVVVRHGRASSV